MRKFIGRLRQVRPDELAVPAIVVLVGIGAFGLGRLSVVGEGSASLFPAKPSPNVSAPAAVAAGSVANPDTTPHNFVASKNGTKYYSPTCSNNISETNKVYFATAADALAAGYTPAANCKGL